MKAAQDDISYRYQQTLRRKKEQLADAEMEIEALQKYLRCNETAVILNYHTEMKRRRLSEDIQELNHLLENLKTKNFQNHSLIPPSAQSLINKKNAHLNAGQRQKIQQGIAAGKSNAQIAREIGVHRSTVGREIKRNTLERENYQAQEAQHLAKLNQRMAFSFREFKSLGMSHATLLQKRNTDYPVRRHTPLRFDPVVGIRMPNTFPDSYTPSYGKYVESGGLSDFMPLVGRFYDKFFSADLPDFFHNDSTAPSYHETLASDKIYQPDYFSGPLEKNNFRTVVRNQSEKEFLEDDFAGDKVVRIFYNQPFNHLAIQAIKPSNHLAILTIKPSNPLTIRTTPAISHQKLCA
jgi:uncharacterized membrane protein affecting hemolysin expression